MKKERPATLVLVRHAESERNKVRGNNIYFTDDEDGADIRGIPDHEIAITSRGSKRVEKTGVFLRERFGQFDYAYHSGYRRTIETMDLLLKAYTEGERDNVRVIMNQFIRERDPGYTYDMSKAEIKKYFPYLQPHWDTFGGFFSRPPGGESFADVTRRVYLFLNMLFRDRGGQKILVVTHGGTLRCFRFLLEHWNYEQALEWSPGQRPENCGVTNYKYSQQLERLVLEDYNFVCK